MSWVAVATCSPQSAIARRASAQARALRAMGIEHRVRPDGTVAVLRSHVEEVLGGKSRAPAARMREVEPDWAAIRA